MVLSVLHETFGRAELWICRCAEITMNYLPYCDNSNNNDNDNDVVGDDDEESPEAKLERERLRRQQNNARER